MLKGLKEFALGVVSGTIFDKGAHSDAEKKEKVASMFAKYKKMSFQDVDDVSSEQLKGMMERGEKVVLVDCRPDDERVSSIPGAVQQDAVEVESLEPETTVVCFCTVGYRSGVFGKKIQEKNDKVKVKNLQGGILAWCHEEGTQVVDESGKPTKTVHVYGKTWNLLPEGFDPVMGPKNNLVHL